MNYADMSLALGTQKVECTKVVEALVSLAEELGVTLLTEHEVKKINHNNGKATSVTTNTW